MADKRISQLNSHTSPTGSDLFVVVNNNETKKITYADLIDGIAVDNTAINDFTASYLIDSASFHTRINAATNEQDLSEYVTQLVVNTLSGSVDGRLDSLEGSSGSYETKGRGILSGSISYTSLTNIPSGIISQSTDLSSLNSFTQSIDGRVDSLESWSSSLDSTFATDLQVSIVSSSVAATIGVISQNTGLLSTSSFNEYTASQSTSSLVDRLDSIENVTSSYELKGSGILSGSISYTDLTNIPSGIVSQSVDIADFTFTEQTITNASITLEATNSDIVLNADGDVYKTSATAGNQLLTSGYLSAVIGDGNRINTGTGYSITDNLDNIINSIPTIPAGTISGSAQINELGFVSSPQTGSFATTGSNTYNGNQTINGSLTLNISTGIPTGVSNWNGQGGWNQGFYSSISTTGGTGTGLTVDVAAGGGGYINIGAISINNPGSGYTDGDIITIDNENNLPGSFTLQVGASSLQFNSSSVEFHDLTLNGTGSFQSDLTVYGNLKVWGTQSIINSTNVELSDNILYLSPSGGGDYDLGIVGHYDDGTYSHTGIFSDASDGHTWKVFKGLTAETTGAFIDTNGVGFTLADFKANNIYGGIYATNGVISGSSQLTSSFDTRYTLSGSVSSTPTGTISGSSQLTASFDTRYLNTGGDGVISGSSQLTSSLATTGSNSFNGNQTITGSVIVSSNIQTVNGYVHTSLLYNGGPIEIRSNFQPLQINSNGAGTIVNDNTQISGSLRVSGSIFSNGIGLISGSSQLTASYDTRYALSGSGGGTIPAGTISGSSQLTSSFDGRYVQTGSFNAFTASALTTGSNSFSGSQNITGSLIVSSVAVVNGAVTIPTGSTISLTSGSNLFVDSSGAITGSLTGSVFGIGDVSAFSSSVNTRLNSITSSVTPAGTISGSSQLTSSFEVRGSGIYSSSAQLPSGLVSGSSQILGASGIYSSSAQLPIGIISGSSQLPTGLISGSSQVLGGSGIYSSSAQLPIGIISGSSQLTASYDTRYAPSASYLTTLNGAISSSSQVLGGSGIYSSSAQLPSGLISGSSQLPSGLISGSSQLPSGLVSGSSQLTASYDTRYTLSGSVVSGTTPAGTISGSSQLTSSYDGRYTLTSSFNSFTASAQAVTTGSNTFNGTQTITGSLNITNGNIVASQITANTASLYLTSGSNLVIQNNGTAEITGSLKVSGSTISLITTTLQIGTGSGDEGGEILLAKSVTNNSLTGSGVTIDSYQDRVRIFEQGGNVRGVFVDLAKAPAGVGGELMFKTSAFVNAGTFVTLGDLKATLTSSSNRGLSLATVAGTVTGYISGHYQGIISASAGTSSTTSLSTTATTSMFGWNFGQQGDMSTYILRDDTNSRVYRIILIIGASYNNNFISIERLH